MSHVNIVTSDRGWILEKLAREIATRLPYVTFGEGPDPAAAIQYYVTYSCRHRRLSPVEVAYFAHLEPEGEAREKFFQVAREVEHAVCHARLYEAMLREAGVAHVSTIPPGVDLESFRPKLRIGVVGRTYHTGRKGEALVAEVMDIPEIEWSFTGEGWPGPALDLPGAALPDFYRSLDYVLVPALYEGGPMCVVEALAVGTEVIAPPIGWVPDFPHIEYRAGDAADLRRVLLELVEKKRALRASVLGHTWDAWAEGHDRLFRELAGKAGLALAAPAARAPRPARPRRVGLFLHGNEHRAQGGPTVRVPRLARELRENGTEAELRIHPAPDGFDGLDLVHVFNGWSPWSGVDLLRRARRAGKAVVFSPIFLDLGARDIWEDRLLAAFAEAAPGAAADAALQPVLAALQRRRSGAEPPVEAAPGFHAAMREMASLADRLVFLSERERQRLGAIGAAVGHGAVVRNPVDAALFAGADPALFERETGLRDFVLCVARIEPRKNQLLLAHALRDTGLPLVLLGHAAHPAYRDLVARHAGPGLRILDRLPPNSPLLAAAFAAARVAVLPSWAEGAPLAALEAAAAGAALVLSDESGEREYFGDHARYCDPADPAALRAAVLDAYETRRDEAAIAAQRAFIAETYSWDRHRAATQAAHAEALAAARARPAPRPAAPAVPRAEWRPVRIVYDVTTSANHAGRWTGIARVEAALAIALRADPRAEVRFVAWNNRAREFVEVPFEGIRAGKLARFLAHHDTAPVPPLHLPAGAHYVVPGSGWMQNQIYAESTVAFARRHGLRLTPVIHDIIPTKFPFWFNDGYAPVFEQNLAMLLDGAEHILAISQATKRDVEAHAGRVQGLFIPEVSVFREGDEIGLLAEAGDAAALARIAQDFAGRPFVLTVGAIHQRKNHRLLYDVWLKLAERMGPRCPHLVIVGGVAWNGHDVARALRGDPRIRDRVAILEDVDDAALDWLYRHCLFTVYPSLYEGWGLPVAESLRYGKACLAADTSSVPEIAPGLVELIDPLDVAAWAARVQFLAASRAARAAAEARIAARHRPFTWAQSAEMLLDTLERAEAIPRGPRPYVPGQPVSFADRVAAGRIRGAGWHPFEKWGCWAAAPRAELVFEPSLPPEEPLVLIVEARALSFPDTPFDVRVLADDRPVARWRVRAGGFQVLHALVPRAIAARPGPLRIAFESTSLTPVREVTRSEDPRQVGIGLARVALAPLSAVADAGTYLGAPPNGAPRLRLDHMHDLRTEPEARGVLAGRWTPLAGWGLVSAEQRARLEMVVQERPGCDLDLALRLRPVATAAAPLLLIALLNGEEVGAWTLDSDAPVTLRAPLPGALRARAEPMTLDLVAADARAPRPLGLGTAEEAFGFGLVGFALHLPGRTPARPRLGLAPGQPLLLAAGQLPEGDAALGPGWHAPEADATWSFGAEADLPLSLSATGDRAVLIRATIEAFPVLGPGVAVPVEITAGGRLLARPLLPPGQARQVEIAVPAGLAGPEGALDLGFRVPAARTPLALGLGEDERPLGLRVARLDCAAAPEAAAKAAAPAAAPPPAAPVAAGLAPGPALLLDLAAEGALHGARLVGWYEAEPEGRWSQAEEAAIHLPGPPEGANRVAIGLFGRVFGTGLDGPAEVEVAIEGGGAAPVVFPSDDFTRVAVELDCARLPAGTADVVLRLRRPGALSPAEAGLGDDDRRLGVLLRALSVVWR